MRLPAILTRSASPAAAPETQAQRLARGDAAARESLIAALAADDTGYELSGRVPGRNGILAEVQRRRAARGR